MPTLPANRAIRRITLLVVIGLAAFLVAPSNVAATRDTTRFSTFNASLNRGAAGVALTDLSDPRQRPGRRRRRDHPAGAS